MTLTGHDAIAYARANGLTVAIGTEWGIQPREAETRRDADQAAILVTTQQADWWAWWKTREE